MRSLSHIEHAQIKKNTTNSIDTPTGLINNRSFHVFLYRPCMIRSTFIVCQDVISRMLRALIKICCLEQI